MSTIDTETYLARITALLDKAESTSFPAEAEAFMAKAQELMARHAIDEAMVAGARTTTDQIEHEHHVIDAPYASAKSSLLGAVAHANRCRMVLENRPGGRTYCTVVGHATDLANVRTLYTSLSFQAVRFMLDAQVPAHDTPRRFRHAFLLAYASRVGQRLLEAEQSAAHDAQSELQHHDGPSVAMVLASRSEQVDQAFRHAFPNLRTRTVSASSAAGFASGKAAANRAALGQRPLGAAPRGLPQG